MKRTKLLGTVVAGVVLLGLSSQVLAAEYVTSNGDGSQTIDARNEDDKAEITGKIKVNGNLGVADNTDPDGAIPEGSSKWINVTLPVATVFGSTDGGGITSPDYTIKNNSGRPVDILLHDYTIDSAASADEALTALTELNIEDPSERDILPLAKNGASVVTPGSDVFLRNLDAAVKGVPTSFNFNFTGEAAEIPGFDSEKDYNIVSELVLKFEAVPLKAK